MSSPNSIPRNLKYPPRPVQLVASASYPPRPLGLVSPVATFSKNRLAGGSLTFEAMYAIWDNKYILLWKLAISYL